MTSTKIGVIDIGTLKVKFMIAEAGKKGKLTTKYQSNELTCLGVRMHESNNRPWPEHLEQTLKELARCQKVLESEQVDRVRVVSTHALREMGDIGHGIAEEIKRTVGLNVEIISQREEAELFFNAVIKDFNTDEDFTIIDVGGGSVQLLVGNRQKLKEVFLLRTGAQYLFDNFSPRHTGTDFPTRAEIRKMTDYIIQELAPVPQNLGTPLVYGSSCIIDVFKTVGLSLERYQFSHTHPYRTEIGALEKFLQKIIPIPYDKREALYPFSQKYYMWGIDKAFLNVITIGQRVNSPYVIPSNANINQGLLLSAL